MGGYLINLCAFYLIFECFYQPAVLLEAKPDRDYLKNFDPHCVSHIHRIGPIVTDALFPDNIRATEGNNINGPSLIAVPDWVENPLGKYYLYFSHHRGQYIRLAYAKNISGPYTLYEEGVQLKTSFSYNHIASPDVHVLNTSKMFVMYFHTLDKTSRYGQLTDMAVSLDGIHYEIHTKDITRYYFRRFNILGEVFGIAPNGGGNRDFSVLHRSKHGESYRLATNASFFPLSRHVFVHPIKTTAAIALFSVLFEAPERIYCARLNFKFNKDKNASFSDCPKVALQFKGSSSPLSEGPRDLCNYVWVNMGERQTVLLPEMSYEGGDLPIKKSVNGASDQFVREVRDPYVFVDKDTDKSYLLYTYGGEKGIAIANVQFTVRKFNGIASYYRPFLS